MNPNITKEGIEVKEGQVWRDLDKRMTGRTVTVRFAVGGVAVCDSSRGRKTELAINRMHRHSTGWALVPSAAEPTPKEGK